MRRVCGVKSVRIPKPRVGRNTQGVHRLERSKHGTQGVVGTSNTRAGLRSPSTTLTSRGGHTRLTLLGAGVAGQALGGAHVAGDAVDLHVLLAGHAAGGGVAVWLGVGLEASLEEIPSGGDGDNGGENGGEAAKGMGEGCEEEWGVGVS